MPRSEIPVGGDEVGAEYLTWLWHAGESGEERTHDGAPVRVVLGQQFKLRAPDGTGAEVVIKGEHASTSRELFVALQRGALIVTAKAQVDLNGTVVAGNLRAESLTLNGCKLPKDAGKPVESGVAVEMGEKAGAEQEQDRTRMEDEARLLTRMGLLDQVQDALDDAFREFLELRAGKGWAKWQEAFRAWVDKNAK
ncbi:MAG: hypothetical protein HY904_08840 [Deltaproteobacteria bacterium]|nr:hypothetical protein [Deltaproteobacteria bacterium]